MKVNRALKQTLPYIYIKTCLKEDNHSVRRNFKNKLKTQLVNTKHILGHYKHSSHMHFVMMCHLMSAQKTHIKIVCIMCINANKRCKVKFSQNDLRVILFQTPPSLIPSSAKSRPLLLSSKI